MLQLCGVIVICALVAAVICLATKNGKQAAKLKELKRELNAIARAQELAATVNSLSDDDANRLLASIATKQRSRMPGSKF